jgi:hypothetical protein
MHIPMFLTSHLGDRRGVIGGGNLSVLHACGTGGGNQVSPDRSKEARASAGPAQLSGTKPAREYVSNGYFMEMPFTPAALPACTHGL